MTNFDPNKHLIQLKSKAGSQDYLPVQWRLVWFRSVCPNGTIETEEVEVDLDRVVEAETYVWNAEKRRSEKIIKQAKGYARFRAVITDGKGGRATGTGSECAADFGDFIEKAETKAIGRGLAALGYGTQFAPEFQEGHRIVDAPVDFSSGEAGNGHAPTPATNTKAAEQPRQTAPQESKNSQQTEQAQAKATEQQINSIQKLCQALKQSEPANLTDMSYFGAKQMIAELSAKYRQQPRQSTNQDNAPIQERALASMIDKAKKRCESINMIWGDVKRDSLRAQVEDKDLTVAQVAAINSIIDQYEKSVSKAS